MRWMWLNSIITVEELLLELCTVGEIQRVESTGEHIEEQLLNLTILACIRLEEQRRSKNPSYLLCFMLAEHEAVVG